MLKSFDGYEETLISWVDLHCMDLNITLEQFDFHIARFMMNS